MKFKKLKYNLICIISCLLIMAAVLCNIFIFKSADISNNNNIPAQDKNIETDENNSDYSDNNGGTSNPIDDDNSQTEEFDPNLPSTKYPLKFLTYCMNKLTESQGYMINGVSDTSFNAVGISGTNHTQSYTIKSGDLYYERCDFYPKGTAAVFSDFKYRELKFYDGEKTEIWTAPDGKYDLTKNTHQTEEDRTEFYANLLDPFPELNKNLVSVTLTSEQDKKTGKTIYIVTVHSLDTSKMPRSFYRDYEIVKGYGTIKTYSQSTEFLINENGWITQIHKKDEFSGDASGISISGTINVTQKFTKQNQDLTEIIKQNLIDDVNYKIKTKKLG